MWTPEGFDRYRELYPRTPPLLPEPDREWTGAFARIWHAGPGAAAQVLTPSASRTTIVFVRGYLGHYMPRNLTAARDALRRLEFDAFVVANYAGGTVARNVAAMARHLERRPTRQRLVFCAHSRAGVECLSLLAQHASYAERCDGVVLSQAPHGPSSVIESVLMGRHRESLRSVRRHAAERVQHAGLLLLRARAGGRELSSDIWPEIVASVERAPRPFPILQTASWSAQPTAWLDSFHERLSEIGPGRAHDGQFFLNDLIWPDVPHVLLPNVDHAQPVVGGFGFDPARYWLAALALLFRGATAAGVQVPQYQRAEGEGAAAEANKAR